MAVFTGSFLSVELGRQNSVSVILPHDIMDEPTGGFPVLYLLHGYSDDHSIWMRRTSVERYAAEHNLAVIMPAVNHSFYPNEVQGERYWDYVSEELPRAMHRFFRYHIKQRGGMLAKGRLLGVQYCAALENGLYTQLGNRSMLAAQQLSAGLKALQIPMLIDSPSNQLFPILPHSVVEALGQQVSFEHWSKVDEDHDCIRFVTAWHTTEEEVSALLDLLKQLLS